MGTVTAVRLTPALTAPTAAAPKDTPALKLAAAPRRGDFDNAPAVPAALNKFLPATGHSYWEIAHLCIGRQP
jgi:hypothetical protein